MRKTVKWKIPFASVNGTQYRIDIYAASLVDSSTELVGAASPFSTDENNTDEYFASMREQTACITLIDPDGTLFDTIVPANNLDRPVRLVRVSDSKVMWQGFLSSEAYSQQYTSRPQELTINCNSVLAAMQSVELEVNESMLFNTIVSQMVYCLKTVNDLSGIQLFDKIHLSSVPNWYHYIYMNSYFDVKEIANEDTTIYDVHSVNCMEMLSKMVRHYGCTIREVGRDLYVTQCKSTDSLIVYAYSEMVSKMANGCWGMTASSMESTSQSQMSVLNWKGVGHQKTIIQGAKSVEVSAPVKKFSLDLSVPGTPYGNLSEYYNQFDSDYMYIQMCTNDNPYPSILSFAYYKASINPNIGKSTASSYATTTKADMMQNTIAYNPTSAPARIGQTSQSYATYRAGAMLVKLAFDNGSVTYHNTKDGLYLSMFPGMVADDVNTPQFYPGKVRPIFSMKTKLPVGFVNGYINIQAAAEYIAPSGTRAGHGKAGTHEALGGHENRSPEALVMSLRFGEKYWNGFSWVSEESTFVRDFADDGNFTKSYDGSQKIDEVEGLLIPIDQQLCGIVELYIWPQTGWTKDAAGQPQYGRFASEMYFSKLEATYIPERSNSDSDRSSNNYYKQTGVPFREDKSNEVSLISSLHNNPSANMLYDSTSTPVRFTDSTAGTTRPEKLLLERMNTYYSSPRRILSLETDRPDGDLPTLRISGYDGKTYIAMAESRDWQQDKSTLTLIETE